MAGRFRRIQISEFFRNFLTLISGTTLAQIISLALLPVFTRIYSPYEFGVFGLFMSIITITVILSSGKYELAVMLPREDRDSVNLVALCGLLSVGVSGFLLAIVVLFHGWIAVSLGNPDIEFWLYFIPLATFLNGIYQSLNYWSNRFKRYRNITAANLGQSLANNGMKLGLGALVSGPVGLITGTLTGQAAGFGIFGSSFLKHDVKKLGMISGRGIREVARRYRLFPKFNMLLSATNNLSGGLPVFIFTPHFGSAAVGLYTTVLMISFRPLNLVSSAFKQVLSQQTIQKQNEGKVIMPHIRKLLWRLFQFSFLPFLALGLFAPPVIRVVLGPEYEEAGMYLQLILPWLFFVLLSAPLSFLPDLFSRQGRAFLIELVKLALRISALVVGVVFKDIHLAIGLFGGVSMVVAAYQLLWFLSLARRADAVKKEKPESDE